MAQHVAAHPLRGARRASPRSPSPLSTLRCGTCAGLARQEPLWRLLGAAAAEPVPAYLGGIDLLLPLEELLRADAQPRSTAAIAPSR